MGKPFFVRTKLGPPLGGLSAKQTGGLLTIPPALRATSLCTREAFAQKLATLLPLNGYLRPIRDGSLGCARDDRFCTALPGLSFRVSAAHRGIYPLDVVSSYCKRKNLKNLDTPAQPRYNIPNNRIQTSSGSLLAESGYPS